MGRLLLTVAGCTLALAGCDPVSPEVRARHEADAQARVACYQAAGFATGEVPPAPEGGGARRAPGGGAYPEGSLRASDGSWINVYVYSERPDDPAWAPAAAIRAAESWSADWATPGYTGARAVGRRVHDFQTPAPFANPALDACLAMR